VTLAFRLATQGLARRDGGALRSWAVQDSPPGAAATALLARGEALGEHVALYNARTATALVPVDEAAAFGAALLPWDDAGYKAIAGLALPGVDEGYAEPVALAVDAVADALDGVTLSRDDLHEALRQRLPMSMLPWCEGCRSHHARRGLLVLAGLHGKLCIAGRVGRQPAFARTDQRHGWDPPADPGPELVRRYLHGYGPSNAKDFAAWAGIAPSQARALWDRVETVMVDGGELLPADRALFDDPPPAPGVRLLGPGDPLLLARDRELLLADRALHRKVWAATGGAGVVLQDGEPVALWRARKKGSKLELQVDAFARVNEAAVRKEAEGLLPLRGCSALA
jgi:Winged helix DNA-binding domain